MSCVPYRMYVPYMIYVPVHNDRNVLPHLAVELALECTLATYRHDSQMPVGADVGETRVPPCARKYCKFPLCRRSVKKNPTAPAPLLRFNGQTNKTAKIWRYLMVHMSPNGRSICSNLERCGLANLPPPIAGYQKNNSF